MPVDYYIIQGVLTSHSSSAELVGLRIEAWDRDLIFHDLVGSAVTDSHGRFKMTFTQDHFDEIFLDRRPDLFFRVYSGDMLITSTEETVLWNVEAGDVEVMIEVDYAGKQPSTTPAAYTVSGTLRQPDQTPLAGIAIRVFDRDLRHEQLLGEAITGRAGQYAIQYTSDQFRRAEKETADLVVRAYAADGNMLAESPTLFNAPSQAAVDLTVRATILSEYERYLEQITPLLESVALADLIDEDVRFLSGDTEIPQARLEYLRTAARLAAATHLPLEVFYGLFRQNLPTDLQRLLLAKPARLRQALQESIDAHIVPAALKLDEAAEQMRALAVESSMGQPDGAGGSMLVGHLIATSTLPVDLQRQLVDFAIDYDLHNPEFWAELQKHPTFGAASTLDEIRFALLGGSVVKGNTTLLSHLQHTRQKEGWQSIRDVARLRMADWEAMGASTEEATAITARVEKLFLTDVVAFRLADDPNLRSEDLVSFFSANADFDLLRTPISKYLNNGADLQNVKDRSALQDRLLGMQRVLRIAPEGRRFETMRLLLTNNYTSAWAIVQDGQQMFMETMTPIMGYAEAAATFENAQARADIAQIAHQRVGDYLTNPLRVLPHVEPDPSVEIPTWARLFGSLNACACEHCRSMYSPAAYLLDLLQFLKEAPGANRPLDVLLARRPDIEHIELSCANGTTALPYIDLVNELLEVAVVSDASFDWRAYQTPDFDGLSKAEAEERLRSQPQHEHRPAYTRLAAASFPWILPFDLNQVRIRLFSQHLGVDLSRIRELYGATEETLAQTYLSLSQREWELLTEPSDLGEVWGTSDPARDLARVPDFLRQTGLSYQELDALAASWLFSSLERAGEVSLVSGSDACDIESYTIVGLTDTVLQQLPRFVRLQRKLGWSIATLDNTLEALGAPRIDAPALVLLARAMRLAERLRSSIPDLMAPPSGLAGTLRISENDLTLFTTLLGMVSVAATPDRLRLLEEWDTFRVSSFDLPELAYILQGWDQTPPVFTPLADDLRLFLRELHRTVRENEAAQIVTAQGDIQREVNTYIETLPLSLSDEERDGEAELFLARYVAELRPGWASEAIVENVARRFETDRGVMERLLRRTADSSGAAVASVLAGHLPGEAAIEDLLAFALIEAADRYPDEVDPAAYEHASALLLRLDRVTLLLRRLGTTRRELDVIVLTQTDNGFLALDQLTQPRDRPEVHAQRYEGWRALVRAKQVQADLPRADLNLFDFLAYAARPSADSIGIETLLSAHTGWGIDPTTREPVVVDSASGQTLLGKLVDDLGLNAAAFRQVETYARLNEAIRYVRRWRIGPDALSEWGSPATLPDLLAQRLKETAQARHTDESMWLKVLAPIQDALREQKRDALLAYLLAHPVINPASRQPAWQDVMGVYAYYLIDPEMSACQLTSRINQANATIQLFAQRIQMSLEDGLLPTEANTEAWDKHWEEWAWRKNYRVWEANRKVFLYPENWILAELLDRKSPFFRELEDELLQDEIDAGTIEQAYTHYLEKLDGVARLDVRGFYHDLEKNGEGGIIRDVLHVFARTFSEPYLYYYRGRDRNQVWTAWKKVDVNIEGEHLIPVVHNGRLLLFWATFTERDTFWDINIHWSENRDGRWEARQSGKLAPMLRAELLPSSRTRFPSKSFFFRAWDNPDDGRLELRLFTSYILLAMTAIELAGQRPYSIATFVFDDCDKTLRLKLDETTVSFLAFPPGMVPRAMVLLDKEQPLEVTTQIIGEQDTLTYGELANILSTNEHDQGVITRSEYSRGLGDLLSDAVSLDLSASVESLLGQLNSETQIVPLNHTRQFLADQPFFIQDAERSFLINREETLVKIVLPVAGLDPVGFHEGGIFRSETILFFPDWWYRFETFYHPYVCELIARLRSDGIKAVLSPPTHVTAIGMALIPGFLDRQYVTEYSPLEEYRPTDRVQRPLPREIIDFSLTGTYAQYNWELFFHIPLLVAERLSANQRFEEAQRWFHYIFDPTDISPYPDPAKFWKVKPFFALAYDPPQTLDDLLREIAFGSDEDAQVQAWRDDPFNPHAIARLRLIAYMKTVVMKYLDNLIAWGDYLFQQDTMESINEATQLYLLAAEILGPRGVTVARQDLPVLTFADLNGGRSRTIDELSNAWIDLESHLPADLHAGSESGGRVRLLPYFCIPANDKLLAYWDTVADRLFKIRHCMNVEGQVRRLPLFEPPIDPALLVRARAAGLDLRTVLSSALEVGLPSYRYALVYQKALEFCNEVRGLGSALLAALEKRDAEELGLLRARHEVTLLSFISEVRKRQIDEANEMLESMRESRKLAEARLEFYTSRGLNAAERAQVGHLHTAHGFEVAAQLSSLAASIAYLFPDFTVTAGMPPSTSTTYGGSNYGKWFSAGGAALQMFASQYTFEASLSSIQGNNERRQDDWNLQATLAQKEIAQIDRQIAAAEIRVAIAEQELANHERQLEQSREVGDLLRSKFTNHELYSWMVSQLAGLHYQAFRLAHDLARKAERAAQHELGLSGSEFAYIGFEHWDSMRKGLLAGDRLHQDLRRMDAAYLEKNKRQLELTKHISLAMLDPMSLLELKERGTCTIRLPEPFFDLDFPGHYNRRIKSVSLTIPCVTGPYTNVSCTLRLVEHTTRISTEPGSSYYPTVLDDTRFRVYPGLVNQTIATSSAQNDSGLFELSFRDERYLPFEGAGTVSTWQLELPGPFRQFDYDTISDVILHIHYTAMDGGASLKSTAVGALTALLSPPDSSGGSRQKLARLFSVRRDFSNAWYRFMQDGSLPIDVTSDKFPFFTHDFNIEIERVGLFIRTQVGDISTIRIGVQTPSLTELFPTPPAAFSQTGSVFYCEQPSYLRLGTWYLEIADIPEVLLDTETGAARFDLIDDIGVVCFYSLNER